MTNWINMIIIINISSIIKASNWINMIIIINIPVSINIANPLIICISDFIRSS